MYFNRNENLLVNKGHATHCSKLGSAPSTRLLTVPLDFYSWRQNLSLLGSIGGPEDVTKPFYKEFHTSGG